MTDHGITIRLPEYVPESRMRTWLRKWWPWMPPREKMADKLRREVALTLHAIGQDLEARNLFR